MNFPPKIISERFGQNFRPVRLGHDDVMFETVFADVAHEFLQLRNFRDGAVAKSVELVIGEFAFADVSADFAVGIGGGNATKGQRPGGRAAIQRAVGVFDAENAAENRRVGDLDVGQKRFRPVAAMEQHALVVVVRIIVVPIHERGGRAAGKLHGIHREHAGNVHLAGAGKKLLAHHAHQRANIAAEVLLHGGPALDRRGVNRVGVHPFAENDAEFRHLQKFFRRHAGRGRVAFDFGQFLFHGGGGIVELAGLAQKFRKINGRDADAVAFEKFFRITNRVEGAGPGTDRAEADTAQAIHNAADAEEILQIDGKARSKLEANVFARQ